MVMPNTLLISPSDLICTNPSDVFTNKEGTARKMAVPFVPFVPFVRSATSVASVTFVIDFTNAAAANSTWLTPPAVSVATTVRITLPASTVTVSTHNGKEHCSCSRKLALIKLAFAS